MKGRKVKVKGFNYYTLNMVLPQSSCIAFQNCFNLYYFVIFNSIILTTLLYEAQTHTPNTTHVDTHNEMIKCNHMFETLNTPLI